MADSGKPISELGLLHTLPGRLKLLVSDADNTNKPDFRQLDLGSPVSPLRPRPAISSSSSSSGSGSGSGGNGNGSHFLSTSRRSDSGELSADSSPTSSVGGSCSKKSTHFRSYSAGGTGGHPLIYSGGSSATSPTTNVLPTGNICPSGKILKTGMMANRSSKTDVLSFGTCNYGHGSIMRGGSATKTAVAGGGTETPFPNPRSSRRSSIDPEELKRKGNEEYKRGHFIEALSYYDRAIAISPENAAYHCNRGAALMSLKRLTDAVKECDEAIKLDSGYVRAHHRLGSLLISLGQVENARRHLCFPGSQPDPNELKRLQTVESHLSKCTTSRRVRDWARVLRECDAAILFACKAEALLKLSRLDDADLSLSSMRKFEASCSLSFSQQKFFGMAPQAFENAVTTIEKSGQIDPRNVEIAVLLQNVRSVSRARACGNDFFKSERFKEACSAYGEGLRLDPSNPVLYCNRAACWFKLGQLERSLDDCNQALLIHPNYTKALLRRAAIYTKLDRWAESLRDYEVLKRELPNNNEIAESLFHAQVALKKSRGEEVYNMKFGGASVVLFKSSSEPRCKQISPFLDTLCTRYPSITFLKELLLIQIVLYPKVDVEENQKIAKSENVGIVPTIKIYKKGNRAKEMVNPSQEALESSVKPYSS
ncbi:Tetratricopeptide-like helical [Cynara cardunculus var. scolymus]|uniref:Tetratricopeptide-like helical n=1 Tax=Cynara cardunculus var. scolymus TaxID=59895 RepID=A0A118K1A7_CYNCS|nr:Tetratricopeptide-like helical [Cynara cardunculus var. scolymus]